MLSQQESQEKQLQAQQQIQELHDQRLQKALETLQSNSTQRVEVVKQEEARPVARNEEDWMLFLTQRCVCCYIVGL